MDRLLDITILALATWRLASLLSQEDGPFTIIAMFRYWLGERYDQYSSQYVQKLGDHWRYAILYEIADQVTCLWCCSVWVGVLLAILYAVAPPTTVWLALPFALSAVAVYLNARARFRKKEG